MGGHGHEAGHGEHGGLHDHHHEDPMVCVKVGIFFISVIIIISALFFLSR